MREEGGDEEVLEDGGADGDAPRLGEHAGEGEEGERRGGVGVRDGQGGERRERPSL